MKKLIYEVEEKLRSKEYKLTPQRELILTVLFENKEKHLSAEDVYYLVKKKCPDVGLATVYRTLELFLSNDIVQCVNFGDGRKRYEIGDQDVGHHHHHAICLKCGKIIEINEDLLEDLENKVSEEYHFKVINHKLKLLGYCSDCIDKKK